MVAIKIGRSSKLVGDLTIQKLLERRFIKRHKYLDKTAMLSYGLPQSIYSERRSENATMIFPRYGISLDEILEKARCNETIPFSDETVYKFLDKMVSRSRPSTFRKFLILSFGVSISSTEFSGNCIRCESCTTTSSQGM